MTLSVADISRWDADAVRAVADAAGARAEALGSAADGLGALPGFGLWQGEAATAAREAIGMTRADLEAAGRQAAAVAKVVSRAALGIEGLQAELRGLTVDAALSGCEIDPVANRVMAKPWESREGVPALQHRLDSIVEQANSLDSELAAALGSSDGGVASSGSSDAMSRPLPEDPRAFRELWQRLSHAERDQLYDRDPAIANHPGMPVGNPHTAGKDHYLRRRLAEELTRAQAAGSADLADLQALDRALTAHPDIRLMLLDTRGERLRAAFAAGNPDTATHVSVSVPGMNTTVADSVDGMVTEAIGLRQLASRQLAWLPGRAPETVATIGWIGYQTPQVRARDGLPAMVQGAIEVSHDDVAAAAAQDLSRFYAGIQAARDVGPAHLTAIGHSYGSLTTGLALQVPGGHGVKDAVFYGSPGIAASVPGDLGLAPGHVFAMATPDDPIRWAYDGPTVARALAPVIPGPLDDALLAAAEVSGAGEFGPNPAGNPAFVQMETEGMWGLEGASGHSEYPRAGHAGERTSVYNVAAVVAGLDGNVMKK
ncbi:MAG: alpha/beta hydrolase [Actinomycetota bacterium]|nr:alpha/beta hydrolase [Actinomycetota bacterium]